MSYEYNASQRPVRVFKAGSNSKQAPQLLAEHTYNRFGERIKKVVYSNTKKPTVTYYLYDGHTLSAEADEQGEITAQYLYLNEHQPIAKLEGKTLYAIHSDHLGTPRLATDTNQHSVWAADYSPFGQAKITQQTITLNLRLPGQYEDEETGTHYNYFRTYDPSTGRYVEADPIGLDGGMNLYAYAGGNPLKFTDPTGLDYWIEGAAEGEGGLGFHQSICVGQYKGSNRVCISFGVKDSTQCEGLKKCKGEVYYDNSRAGDIVFGRYRSSTTDQDKQILDLFEELVGKEASYDLINNNCRDFVYRVFRSLEFRLRGGK